ncbi:MAG: glycoside hydrolase family 26 protein [Acidimicrobiales bacterium]
MRRGLHLDDVPQRGLAALEAVEARVGAVQIVHWFQAWGGGYKSFRSAWFDRVTSSGRVGLISWEPWEPTGEVCQPAFAPATIVSGAHDAYIDSWADGFAARHDGPWYLRPMHEMNGDWYPWAGGVDGTTPELYREAWQHLHQRFAAAGATNVAWVWCPLADDVSGPFEEYYPGDAFVDILALDGYNWGAATPEFGGWRNPSQIFAEPYRRLTALGPQPIWFAEVGCAPDGGDKARWVEAVLDPSGLERLAAVIFFGLNKERDWRIDADTNVAAAVRTTSIG